MRRILKAGAEVLGFEEREIGEDFRLGRAAREHVQHVFDANPIMADAGTPATLLRIKGDAFALFRIGDRIERLKSGVEGA